jgi:drug/metabolite transporter (DMT)-like permease
MHEQPAMSLFEWSLLLLLSLLWGGSFFFSKVALLELPPLTVVLVRVSFAASALFVYLRVIGTKIPNARAIWLAFVGMGLLNNFIPFSLIFWGQTQIASGLASIINATTPVFSILVAHFLTADEKMSANKTAGIVLGIAGVAVLMGPRAFSNDGPPLIAMLACLGAALSYGFASVFGRRFKRMGIQPTVVAFGQVTASTLMMLPIVMIVDAPWHLPFPHIQTIGALLALALLSTAFAYVLFFRILSGGGALNVSLVTLLIPFSAILLGSVFLNERLLVNHFAGMALIAFGLLAIDGRLWRMIVKP